MDNIRKQKIPKQHVRAEFMPKTFDAEKNTVEVIFTTDERVLRRPFFDEPFMEELGMKEDEVRMERLRNGAPLLNNHNQFDLRDQIGVVESADVDGQKGTATVRLSGREEVQGIVQDIKDGIIRNISVGYRVHKFQEIDDNSSDIRVLRAIDWEPMEISFVTVPADKNAQVRSESTEEELYECDFQIKTASEGKQMEQETKKEEVKTETKKSEDVVEETTEEVVETKSEDVTEEVREDEVVETKEDEVDASEVRSAEKKRISDITEICQKFNVDAKSFIDEDKTVDEVRKIVMDKLAEKDKEKGTKSMNNTKVEVGQTDLEKKKEGLAEAMLWRSRILGRDGKERYELTDNAKRFNNLSLIDMAKVVLEARGINTFNMSKPQIAERAFHATGDFKLVLENVLNKSLRDAYQASPQTFAPFTRMTSASDLKEISRVQFGEGSELEKVKEGEEYKHGTVSESAEKYKVEKYGKIINVTEEILINDDLGAFTRIPAMMGQRARDLESNLAWGIITGNPNMSDGFALFSDEHDNLNDGAGGAAAALDEASLSVARQLFRRQVGLDKMKLNLIPFVLAVPTALETVAEKLVTTVVPDQTSNFNPFGQTGRTPLSIIVEPRLDDVSQTAWYLMGSLGQIDMVEMAMLSGSEGPMITQQEGFDIDGLRVKIKHWVGVKAIDYRGLYKNDGA